MGFNFSFGYGNAQKKPLNVEYDNAGNVFYTMFSSQGGLAKRLSDRQKLNAVVNNPALLKVISLDCDLFSMGKINKYQEDKLIETDFLYGLAKQPNLFQSWTQFNWDYKFWLNIYGTAYLYNPNNSKNITSLQWLNPNNIVWNESIIKKLQAFIFSSKGYNEILKGSITYNFDNGESKTILLSEISIFQDLTNIGQSNPLQGISRIDSLYKVINNSELALDAKGINLFLSGRFLVAGKADPDNVSMMPMSETEKRSIESEVLSEKTIHGVKSMIDIKRFVEDMNKLKLDESFLSDYFLFGAMFNIPRDILETNIKGTTYENQEKSMARFVEYSLQPKAQKLTDWFEIQFNFQDVKMSWSHLMFMQVFEKEKTENIKVKSAALLDLIKAGVKLDEINELLGTKFTKLNDNTNI
jgi:hypothetical protein